MSATVAAKPSDFPRDEKFRDPGTPAFRDERGEYHVFSGDLSRLETRILLQEALRRLPGLALDQSRPFVRYAGIVDGVTEAWFTYDQSEALRLTNS